MWPLNATGPLTPSASRPVISPTLVQANPSREVRTTDRSGAAPTKSMNPPPGNAEMPPPAPPIVTPGADPSGGVALVHVEVSCAGGWVGIGSVGTGVGLAGNGGRSVIGTDQTAMGPAEGPVVRTTRPSRAAEPRKAVSGAANASGTRAEPNWIPS